MKNENSKFPIRYITHEQWGGDIDAGYDSDAKKQIVFPVQRGDGFGIITANSEKEQEMVEKLPAFERGIITVLTDESKQTGKAHNVFSDMFTMSELRAIKQLPKEAKDTIKENILEVCKSVYGNSLPAADAPEDKNHEPDSGVSPKGYPTKKALGGMKADDLKDEYVTCQLTGYDNPENFDSDGRIKMNKKSLVDALDAHYRAIEKRQ